MQAEAQPALAGQQPGAGATSRGRGRGSMWDPDEPLAPLPRRLLRAAAVAGTWALAALPVATGWQKCAIATVLHRPCPGCGMTRALHLLASGQVEASLRMHPMALPVLVVGLLFIGSTVWTTVVLGSPINFHRSRLGRWTLAAMVVVYSATLVLWILRWFGFFGGPVPVY
jgi:hypothetical protein